MSTISKSEQCTDWGGCVKARRMFGFLALFVPILRVGGWVSRNPNVVQILKSVGKKWTLPNLMLDTMDAVKRGLNKI